MCLESYCAPIPNSSDHWKLNSGETPNSRQKMMWMKFQLYFIKLEVKPVFSPQSGQPLLWIGQDNEPVYSFYCFASSVISRFVQQPQPVPLERCVLILPGSRSRLLEYKLQHNPYLAEAVFKGWRVVKFRHIRRLAERENLTRAIVGNAFKYRPTHLGKACAASDFLITQQKSSHSGCFLYYASLPLLNVCP